MWKSKGSKVFGLRESIAALGKGPSAKYFTYLPQSEEWFEGVEFAIGSSVDDSEPVISLLFSKQEADSPKFDVEMSYFINGEYAATDLQPFSERKDLYEGVAFNVFLQYLSLKWTLFLLDEAREQFDPADLGEIDQAVVDLKIVLENAILMISGLPSLKNTNIPDLIEALYKKHNLKGTFGEEVFPGI
jgi:hypothetical protein